MKNYVVENYENYREEDRLTTNNARKIEFITTVRVLDEHIGSGLDILDCAAGTGIYAFYLADRGNHVTAGDITPRHVELINQQLETKDYTMKTMVMDACDMSAFNEGSFDVVLNMGSFYHIIDEAQRLKCLSESIRVLKKGGLLITAYIPRFYLVQLVTLMDAKYIDSDFYRQIIGTGVLRHDDEKCFWTDTYYSTKDEMESLYREYGLEIVDHFAQDGLTPLFHEKADSWTDEEFRVWCGHHYNVCREESLLGASNHVIIIGRKV